MSNSLLNDLWKERNKRNKKKESKEESITSKPIERSTSDIKYSDDEMDLVGGRGGGGEDSYLKKSMEKTEDIKDQEISSDEDNSSSDFIDKNELDGDYVRPADKQKSECLMDTSGSASVFSSNIYNTEMYDKEMEYALKLSKESLHNKIENDESHILGVVDDESRFEKEIQYAINLSKAKDDSIDQETMDLIKTLDKSETDQQDNKSYIELSREDQIKNDEFFAKTVNS